MKNLLFITCFVINFFVHSYGQVNCNDYRIVSIFDIPPTPQTPGGNYFLLLLTLDEDNLSNTDNYANLFFADNLGDTISIPTGANSTLPLYASDTIPYILQLNSTNSNQDFPEKFNGKLVIIHATQLICEVNYSNIFANTNNIHDKVKMSIYPNPFVDCIKIESEKCIENILIIDSNGSIIESLFPKIKSFNVNLEKLKLGGYFISIKFENSDILLTKKILKI